MDTSGLNFTDTELIKYIFYEEVKLLFYEIINLDEKYGWWSNCYWFRYR